MSRFIAPDLSKLPKPDVIETLDSETLIQMRVSKLKELWPDYDVGGLEFDPLKIAMEMEAFFELLVRSRINDAARAVMVSLSTGSDLDNLAALFGTSRLESETDDAFRSRVLIALEAFSTAGPAGAYEYHARSANSLIKDARALGPESNLVSPGQVLVALLSSEGNGASSPSLIETVEERLNDKDVRPLTDQVIVRSSALKFFTIDLTLSIGFAPDPELLRTQAEANINALLDERHRIGVSVPRSALIASAHVAGVESVTLNSPAIDVSTAEDEAPFCTGLSIKVERLNG